MRLPLHLIVLFTGLSLLPSVAAASPTSQPTTAPAPVDASTLHRKVMVGYQGWFRCPGDPAGNRWLHWSRNGKRIAPETLTFEMWPDLTGFADDEKFPAGGFTYPDGSQAFLFSSAHPKTVRRHFEWMRDYGIDGAFVQRFLVNGGDPSFDEVLDHCRASAAATGRAYAVCYDLSGAPADKVVDQLAADWHRLVDDRKLTADDRYLKEGGKPVVFVWGFYADRFDAAVAHKLIDLFKGNDRYAATLVGGCQWYWRREKDPEWARAFRRLDVISPWNVGNAATVDGKKHAATGYWKDDLAEAKRANVAYLPVVYPGFSWTNLKGKDAAKQTLPRLGGEFFWRQFAAVGDLGIDMAYVAMFDEVDEGTAIFKVTNAPPTQATFATYEGLPGDWYLRLTGEGAKVVRGERKATPAIPIKP
ncbi:MAG TPA: glycoside hydrolase family 71/99-like protein [Humisphaera sp.]